MITGKFKNYLLHANNLLANLTLLCATFKAPNNVYEKKNSAAMSISRNHDLVTRDNPQALFPCGNLSTELHHVITHKEVCMYS